MGITTSQEGNEVFFIFQSNTIVNPRDIQIVFRQNEIVVPFEILENPSNHTRNIKATFLFHFLLDSSLKQPIELILLLSSRSYSTVIHFLKPNQSHFIFDLSFFSNDSKNEVSMNNSFPTHTDQFNYFNQYLEQTNQPQPKKENLYHRGINIIQTSNKYSFSFFLSVYSAIYNTSLICRLLQNFCPSKLNINDRDDNVIVFEPFIKSMMQQPLYKRDLSVEDIDAILEKYELIILYFYYYHCSQDLAIYLNTSNRPRFIVKIICTYNIYFKSFTNSHLSFIMQTIKTTEEINNVLPLLTNMKNLCQFIYSLPDSLIRLFKEPESLIITPYMILNTNDPIKDILQIISMVNENSAKYFYLKMNDKFIDDYIDMFELVNIDNLYCIRSFLLRIKNKKMIFNNNENAYQALIFKVNQGIHTTGVHLIKLKKLVKISCLRFIILDDYSSTYDYEQIEAIISSVTIDNSLIPLSQETAILNLIKIIKNNINLCIRFKEKFNFKDLEFFDIDEVYLLKLVFILIFANKSTILSSFTELFVSIIKFYIEYKYQTRKESKCLDSSDLYNLISEVIIKLIQLGESAYINKELMNNLVIESIYIAMHQDNSPIPLRNVVIKKHFTNTLSQMNYIKEITNKIINPQLKNIMLVTNIVNFFLLIEKDMKQNNQTIKMIDCKKSQFKDDHNSDSYNKDIVKKIQLSYQKNRIIVLNHFSDLSPKIFELLKQQTNETQVNESKIIFINDIVEHNSFEVALKTNFDIHTISWETILTDNEQEDLYFYMDLLKEITTHGESNKHSLKINTEYQLRNWNIEELQLLKYNNRKQCKEDFTKRFLGKIVPLFSQDIMAMVLYSSLKATKSYIYDVILDVYQKGKHNNFQSFVNSISSYKHLIYTFSSINTNIDFNQALKNTFLGDLTLAMIEEKEIYKIRSEKGIENIIDSFYKNSKLMILILKFNPINCISLNHVECLIQEYEDNHINMTKKCIIFTVHLNRQIISSSNNLDYISLLSPFNQIFIDELNGSDILITKLYKKNMNELYSNESFINSTNLYDINIQYVFEVMEYVYCYSSQITALKELLSNESLLSEIKKYIIPHNQEEGDLITQVLQSTRLTTLSIISEIQLNIIKEYKSCLTNAILKLLNEETYPKVITNDIKEKYKQKISSQQIDCMYLSKDIRLRACTFLDNNTIGYTLQEKSALIQLLKYIKTIKAQYYDNEELMRNMNIDDINMTKKRLNDIKWKEKFLCDSIIYEMKKIPFMESLIIKDKEQSLTKATINSWMEDYFFLFLGNKFQFYNNKITVLLSFLIKKRYSEESSTSLRTFCLYILWIESNIEMIKHLIDIFNLLSLYVPDSIEVIKDFLETNTNRDHLFSRNSPIQKDFLCPFYHILQALICLALRIENQTKADTNKEWCLEYMNVLREVSHKCRIFELTMKFKSHELNVLYFLIKVFNYSVKKGNYSNANQLQYYQLISQEIVYLQQHNLNDLITNLQKENVFLFNYISTIEEYPRLFSEILLEKYQMIDESSYHKEIIEILISNQNDKILRNSDKLLSIIFKEYIIKTSVINEDFYETFQSIGESTNPKIKLFNNETNPTLSNPLLNFFEKQFNIYFNHQIDIQFKLFDASKKCFEYSLKCLRNISENKEKPSLSHLATSYYIAYVKNYLSHYVDVNYNKNDIGGNFSEINNIILGEGESPLRKVILIYILKLFRKYFYSFDDMKRFNWDLHQIDWIDQFNMKDHSSSSSFNHCFLSLKKDNEYVQIIEWYQKDYAKKFTLTSDQTYSLTNNDIVNLLNVTINKAYSNIQTIVERKGALQPNFSLWIKNIITKCNINQVSKDFLMLIYDEKRFNSIFYPSIKELKSDQYEILLYSFKFCLLCTKLTGSWYNKLLTSDLLSLIKSSYIPGGETEENYLVQSVLEIEEYLKEVKDYQEGIFICSFGHWYTIESSQVMIKKNQCKMCNQIINGFGGRMVKRPEHCRIYKDNNHRKTVETASFLGVAGNYQSILFNDLKAKALQAISNDYKGYNKISTDFFNKTTKKIRNLNQICYRLLSWMLYSLLHFGKIFKNENDDYYKGLFKDNKTPLEFIELNWYHLQNELKLKKVESIQIFFNLLFDELEPLLNKYSTFQESKDRTSFEGEITAAIDSMIRQYEETNKRYNLINNRLLNKKRFSIQSVIDNITLPSNDPDTDYPLKEYFSVDKYPSITELNSQLMSIADHQMKYPVLVNYLKQKESKDIMNLFNISKINPFESYMIDNWSYKTTRAQAQKIIIADELKEITEQNIKDSYEQFQCGWNNIVNYMPENEVMKIAETDTLNLCLNSPSSIALGKTMYQIYGNYIRVHNDFLKDIIKKQTYNNKTLLILLEPVTNRNISIQDASTSELLSFIINETNSPYSSFEDLFSIYCTMDSDFKMKSMSYLNQDQINYDFESIESELEKIFLRGKKLLLEQQKTVKYSYELLLSNKDQAYYLTKYTQETNITDIKEHLARISRNKDELGRFLMLLVQLIPFINQGNYPQKMLASKIITDMPTINSLYFIPKNLHVNNLLTVYELVEQLCYDLIQENAFSDDITDLSNEQQTKINNYFNNTDYQRIINKQQLITAVRKFILKKLVGLKVNELNNDKHLLDYLRKQYYWPIGFCDNKDFSNEIDQMIKSFEIHLSDSIAFQKHLMKEVPASAMALPEVVTVKQKKKFYKF